MLVVVCDTHFLSSLCLSLYIYPIQAHKCLSTGKDPRAQILLSIWIEGLLGKKNFLQLNNVGRANVWREHFELELILRESLQ